MRRRGERVDGWVILDKPAGMGSTQAVAAVRRALNAQKAGHAGTLDPDATGLLAVALGEATKTIPVLESALKSYTFEIAWGAETTTDDASGEVTQTSPLRPTAAQIEAALPAFRGDIAQVPPQVSAVKVAGRRAYDLARDGQTLDLAPRHLHVARLVLTGTTPDTATLEMTCGKGGYVRGIARDLGRALGCLGHVLWLRRLTSGPFTLDAAAHPERVSPADLRPLEAALTALPHLAATPEGAIRLAHGNPGSVTGEAPQGALVWVSAEGRPLCLGRHHAGTVTPDRVFNPAPSFV